MLLATEPAQMTEPVSRVSTASAIAACPAVAPGSANSLRRAVRMTHGDEGDTSSSMSDAYTQSSPDTGASALVDTGGGGWSDVIG
jgi:hypothetical protein